MKQYQQALQLILKEGTIKGDRTGTGTISYFGQQLRFDLSKGFPLVTTKFVPIRLISSELQWLISGNTNIKWLQEQNNHIWDEWADKAGDLGPVYGKQWRSWEADSMEYPIDQLANVIHDIRKNPDSRRHIVTAWNPSDVPFMALPPCHMMYQFYVANGRLSCQIIQRSADMFLGVPFNIASYALLTHIVANICNLEVGELIWVGGDTHIYSNHIDQVHELLRREPFELPRITLTKKYDSIDQFDYHDVLLEGYQHRGRLKGEVSV